MFRFAATALLTVVALGCGASQSPAVEPENGLIAAANEEGIDGDPHWSPNGDWIAFTGWDGIYLVRPDGTERTKILGDDVLNARGWSPDGQKLLFEDVENDPMVGIELAALDVERRRRWTLTQMPGHQLLPTWSPDGEKIAFLTTENCVRTGECTAPSRGSSGSWMRMARARAGFRGRGSGRRPGRLKDDLQDLYKTRRWFLTFSGTI